MWENAVEKKQRAETFEGATFYKSQLFAFLWRCSFLFRSFIKAQYLFLPERPRPLALTGTNAWRSISDTRGVLAKRTFYSSDHNAQQAQEKNDDENASGKTLADSYLPNHNSSLRLAFRIRPFVFDQKSVRVQLGFLKWP